LDPAVCDHRRDDVALIWHPIIMRQDETHIESRLIGRLVRVHARHEAVAARRLLQPCCGDDLPGRTDDLGCRLVIGQRPAWSLCSMSIDDDQARTQYQRHDEGGPQQRLRLWRTDPVTAVHDGSYPAIPLMSLSQT